MEEKDTTPPDAGLTSGTVTFADAASSQIENWASVSDPTFDFGTTDSVPLAEWFARPVKIASYDWSSAATLTHEFNPWALWVADARVHRKLANFAYFRGNLHLRFVINGSPFIYGRAIASYAPYMSYNAPLNLLLQNGLGVGQSNQPVVSYLSQLQCEYLDPSSSHSVDMSLPFISPKNWARLYREDATVSTFGNLPDFQAMGSIFLQQMNALRLGNNLDAGGLSVNITVFAWAEDVKLAVPTAKSVAEAVTFVKESKVVKLGRGSSKKELAETTQGKSTISSVASAFSNSFGALRNVPLIGPFATAGSIASTAIADVAKIFGYSRPIQMSDSFRYQPQAISNTAATVGAYTGERLAVDPLNEVTLDPRVGNMPAEDELSLSSIASRESYLTTFTWTKDEQPLTGSATLFRTAVTPHLHSVSVHPMTGQTLFQPTAMAFAAGPFNFWRGTLKLKFQVVASQYHRGRVAVFFEPNATAQELITAVGDNLEYNSRFVEVFDLQELDGVCVEIPWASSRPFLNAIDARSTFHSTNMKLYAPAGDGTSGGYILDAGTDAQYISNGYVEMRVVNRLTSAINDPPPVEINVFVSMEDLEVAFPRSFSVGIFNRTPDVVPTLFVKESKETVVGEFKQDQDTVCHYLVDPQEANEAFQVFFGENIRSFRPLLKRFNAIAHAKSSVVVSSTLRITLPMYPKGWLIESTGEYSPSNTVSRPDVMPLFEYLRYAFIGMRGSVRVLATVQDGVGASTNAGALSINITGVDNNVPVKTESTVIAAAAPRSGGGVLGCYSTNGIISAELPYYTSNRFYFAFNPAGDTSFQWGGPTITDDGIMSCPTGKVTSHSSYRFPAAACDAAIGRHTVGTPDPVTMGVSWAGGDDFTFIGYQAPPCLYYGGV